MHTYFFLPFSVVPVVSSVKLLGIYRSTQIECAFCTTECPRIYRKSVLHLLNISTIYLSQRLKQTQYRFAGNFGTLKYVLNPFPHLGCNQARTETAFLSEGY